jgi:UrcA family protein
MKKIMFAALTVSAFLCTINAAQAEDAQMRVKLADINVASDAGAKTALTRIQFSAANFCEQSSGRESLERQSLKNHCVAEMTRKSVQQLNAPMVTALLGGRTLAEKPAQIAMAR